MTSSALKLVVVLEVGQTNGSTHWQNKTVLLDPRAFEPAVHLDVSHVLLSINSSKLMVQSKPYLAEGMRMTHSVKLEVVVGYLSLTQLTSMSQLGMIFGGNFHHHVGCGR